LQRLLWAIAIGRKSIQRRNGSCSRETRNAMEKLREGEEEEGL
jgi:hypothetical protein